MNVRCKIIIVLILLTTLGSQITHAQVIILKPNQNEVTSIWNEAQNKIIEAYKRIVLIENMGVNTTAISKLLDESIKYYDKGINENDTDPKMASLNFNQSIQISNSVIEYNLNYEINQSTYLKNKLIIITISSSIVVIIVTLLIWIIFKNYYISNMLNKNIEVNKNGY